LNPIRAGLASKPEDYRWRSIGYYTQTNNKDEFLSTDFGLSSYGVMSKTARLTDYRGFLYEKGAIENFINNGFPFSSFNATTRDNYLLSI